MSRSPWLHTAFRYAVALRKLIEFLEHVFHLHVFCHAVSDLLLKLLFDGFLYNKYHLLKSCFHRIVNRKVNDLVTVWVHRVDLLQTAVTAPHPCCHNYQNWFLTHRNCLLREFHTLLTNSSIVNIQQNIFALSVILFALSYTFHYFTTECDIL